MKTRHGLITDSFKVVKKTKRGGKQEKSPTPPPPPPPREDAAESITEEELQKLRQFDLNWRFGPCTGISRMQRWERAELHGLKPPEEVRELLLRAHTHTHSLWTDYPL